MMRRKSMLFTSIIIGISLVIAFGTDAAAFTYIDTVDVYTRLQSSSLSATTSWQHAYPLGLPVESAFLTIVAEGVDTHVPSDPSVFERVEVTFNGTLLGLLNDQNFYDPAGTINPGPGPNPPYTALSTTTFVLDPTWIDPLNNVVAIENPFNWWVEIETSTLTVNAIPEPTTLVLLGAGLIGLTVVGRKKFLKK
jgi:hypothetical protein